MVGGSPPPADACPELTPDNGTPTPSGSNYVGRDLVTRHREEDTGNNEERNNAMYIFNNGNHQASPSGLNRIPEHIDIPAHTRRSASIPSIDIGSQIVWFSCDPPPPSFPRLTQTIRILIETTTAVHLSISLPSQNSTIMSRSRSQHAIRRGARRLRSALPNITAWFRVASRAERGDTQPRRRLSLGWFSRRRNGGT